MEPDTKLVKTIFRCLNRLNQIVLTLREVQFLVSKVCDVGVSNVITDFQNYNRDQIRDDDEDSEVSDSDSNELISEQGIQQPRVSFSGAVRGFIILIKWCRNHLSKSAQK